MTIRIKPYVGNTRTLEVHVAADEQPRCGLDRIGFEHRRGYDTLNEALSHLDYEACYWCMGASVAGASSER